MPVAVVVGAQWGDEGKGKVVDLFAVKADIVARFAGGANAGHTLVAEGRKVVTHLIPSGVLHRGTLNVLGDGMVIDPVVLIEEINDCRALGLLNPSELLISRGAHVIAPFHKLIEQAREAKRAVAIGTTGRGIGPCYEGKAARHGIRIADLLSRDRLRELVATNMENICPLLLAFGEPVPADAEVERWIDELERAGASLAPHFGDAGTTIMEAASSGKNVLLEGAQGALLDIDHGTYPFVTSSSTLASGACQGLGIGPTVIDRVVGITKAYCTRVGGGPFPSEMSEEDSVAWREAGDEFGATTGRPRRCGWLDLPALRRAIRCNGISELAVTKLDVMGCRGPLRACIAYETRDGERLAEMPQGLDDSYTPIYKQHDGWDANLRSARTMEELPKPARSYLDWVSSELRVPISLLSIGPDRAETMLLKDIFRPR